MPYAVEVVDYCSEDHGPSSDECVVAVAVVVDQPLKGVSNRMGCSSREAGGKMMMSTILLKIGTGLGVVPLGVRGVVRRVRWIEHSDWRDSMIGGSMIEESELTKKPATSSCVQYLKSNVLSLFFCDEDRYNVSSPRIEELRLSGRRYHRTYGTILGMERPTV